MNGTVNVVENTCVVMSNVKNGFGIKDPVLCTE